MTNNFKQIRELMVFEPGLFYFGQIIRRRKENPEMATGSQIVSYWYFSSEESWESKTERMAKECDATNARAYIHLNRRSWKKVGLRALTLMATHIANDEFAVIKNDYHSACGECCSEVNRTWIIDVDTLEKQDVVIPDVTEIVAKLPTPNGYHLIVKPFDRRLLTGFDVHKDNPTVAYAPC